MENSVYCWRARGAQSQPHNLVPVYTRDYIRELEKALIAATGDTEFCDKLLNGLVEGGPPAVPRPEAPKQQFKCDKCGAVVYDTGITYIGSCPVCGKWAGVGS